MIYVQKWPWAFGGEYPWWKYWQRPLPSYKEMDELKHRNNLAEGFCFMTVIGNATVKFKSNSVENCELSLVSHDFAQINSFNLESGRYFAESESYGGYPVAIIGYNTIPFQAYIIVAALSALLVAALLTLINLKKK